MSSLYSIQYMQDMTNSICSEAKENDTVQLIDRRDNKKYWVTKLRDNNCWMTQNLDLDLSTSNALTSTYSDVANWTPSNNTQTSTTPSFTTGTNDVQSWDPGQKICTAAGCNVPEGEYDTHYSQGNYYSWGAATAGQASSITGAGQATQSICPKGWTLPINGAYGNLFGSYGANSGITYGGIAITGTPFYFVYGGYVNSSTLYNAGSQGRYWSSTAYGSNSAYSLYFDTNVNPSTNFNRYYGFSVRCVAR